mmetsp:Transcript_73075/g.191574  ORF Transcript_73075/g.191574 Transcript_73075/m.191574 type:complete len:251 (+) Transcript_73075:114-866(+)
MAARSGSADRGSRLPCRRGASLRHTPRPPFRSSRLCSGVAWQIAILCTHGASFEYSPAAFRLPYHHFRHDAMHLRRSTRWKASCQSRTARSTSYSSSLATCSDTSRGRAIRYSTGRPQVLRRSISRTFAMCILKETKPNMKTKVFAIRSPSCLATKKDSRSWAAGNRSTASRGPQRFARRVAGTAQGWTTPQRPRPTSARAAERTTRNIQARTRPGLCSWVSRKHPHAQMTAKRPSRAQITEPTRAKEKM